MENPSQSHGRSLCIFDGRRRVDSGAIAGTWHDDDGLTADLPGLESANRLWHLDQIEFLTHGRCHFTGLDQCRQTFHTTVMFFADEHRQALGDERRQRHCSELSPDPTSPPSTAFAPDDDECPVVVERLSELPKRIESPVSMITS